MSIDSVLMWCGLAGLSGVLFKLVKYYYWFDIQVATWVFKLALFEFLMRFSLKINKCATLKYQKYANRKWGAFDES